MQAYCLAVIRNAKEVEEARSDPEFEKMSDLAKTAFAMKEKSLVGVYVCSLFEHIICDPKFSVEVMKMI